MAGTSTKTEVITIRVPVDLAAAWRTVADRESMTIGKYILARAERPDLKAECDRLRMEIDKLTKLLKPVAALNLPVLTAFPARPVQQRGAAKGKP